jgi:uncharacterized protein (TIGR02611 family)
VAGLPSIVAWVLRSTKRIVVTVVGFALLLAGLVMMVTPGPGLLVIVAGLAVLATEYAWARHWLERTRAQAQRARQRVRDSRQRRRDSAATGTEAPEEDATG